jgi:predicted tellurium resistance membrane protein TerC
MLELAASLIALTTLEVVLGIDNIVVIAVVAAGLPPKQRERARIVGLALAMAARLALLGSAVWIVGWTAPLLTIAEWELSARDMLMLAGGLFLIVKAVRELHHQVEQAGLPKHRREATSFGNAVAQIVAFDLVFSLDSVLTAVGMAREFWVMATAIVVAVLIMLWASAPIVRFIQAHPTVKVLALAFVLLIGVALLADGMGFHLPKGYLYFAMAFAVGIEAVNMAMTRRKRRASQRSPAGQR